MMAKGCEPLKPLIQRACTHTETVVHTALAALNTFRGKDHLPVAFDGVHDDPESPE